MTETTDPGGSDPAPVDPALPDRLPPDGQSITARRAITAPATVDRTARTVEVVWSTGARARNFVPSLGGITEELDMSPNAVRMAQLGSGNAPVLNTHRSSDARDVLGRVIAARLEGGRGHARLQFSGAADVEPLWQRIADGTLRAVSIGYRVHRYDQRPDPVSGEMIYRAVDWEPFEISIVPIPVDRDAQVRGAAPQGAPSFAIEPALENEEPPMTETTPETPAAPSAPPAASPPATITVETPPDLEALRAEAQRTERERISGIDGAIDAARALVGTETAAHIRREAVERGWHPDQARRSLFDAMVKSAAPPAIPARPETGPGHESPSEILDAMAEALAARSMPGYQPQGAGRHAEFMGWRPSDMIGELLRVRGERNVPRNPTLLAERAFHTTSDFPLLLSAAANKMLLAAYQPAAPSYRQIFLRRDFRDFKPHRHLRVGDFPTLMPLMENGEIQAGTMSESQEIVLLQTFARRIRVTRPMLVNDDLGAFTDFAAAIGRRVADFENATAYALVNQANGDGPTLTNGPAAVNAEAHDESQGNVVLVLPTPVTARYLRIDLTDGAAPYMDIGLLVAGQLWRLLRGTAYGIREGRVMLDRRDRNPYTGAEFPVPAIVNPRMAAFTLPALSTAEARNQHRDMLRRLGAARDTLWIAELPDSMAERNRRAIWGAMNAPGEDAAISRDSLPLASRGFRMVERV